MDDAEQQQEKPQDKHALAMERYRALDLSINENGAVQLTSDQQRRIFAYGYHNDGLSPPHLKTWKKTLEAIELIQGMGIPALGNLEYIYEVGGKLTAMHKLCLAACQATGEMDKHHVIWVNDKNEQLSEKNAIGFELAGCVVSVRRRGQQQDALGVFTLEDAKAAGLTERNRNWKTYARDMSYHRASMRALNQQFSDVLAGVQCREIAQDYQQMLDPQGQPAKSADGQLIFQRRLARLRESEKAFAKTTGTST